MPAFTLIVLALARARMCVLIAAHWLGICPSWMSLHEQWRLALLLEGRCLQRGQR